MSQKQILIDKCAFQRAGDDLLCSFVRDHFLVLPHLLYGEIATNSDEGQREILLRRFENAMLLGAYWGWSTRSMIEKEGESLRPHTLLVDLPETSVMRDRFRQGQTFSPDLAAEAMASYLNSARSFLCGTLMVSEKLVPRILAQADETRGQLEPRARTLDRLRFWLDSIDRVGNLDIHAVAVAAFQQFIMTPQRYCLSPEWTSWQYIRLSTVLHLEYTFLRRGRGGRKALENAEHDLQDIEYVVLLSRADGIVTTDEKLVGPLARAAFPEKDVFSSLDEVPGSYRYDRADA